MDDRVDLVQRPMLVTVDQVANMLGVGRTTAWELIRRQKIKSVKIGRTRRVPIEAIQEYIERLMNKDAA